MSDNKIYECPFVYWEETDYDVFSGHSSYIPICKNQCNKDQQCYTYKCKFCKYRQNEEKQNSIA